MPELRPDRETWVPANLKVRAFIAPSTWGILTDESDECLIGEVLNSPDAKRYADLVGRSAGTVRCSGFVCRALRRPAEGGPRRTRESPWRERCQITNRTPAKPGGRNMPEIEMSRQEMEERRLQAALMLQQGQRPTDVARKLGVSRNAASRWRQKLIRHGMEGLYRSVPPGRPCRMGPRQVKAFRKLWATRDHWSCSQFADAVFATLGIRYHHDHIGRLIHQLELRPVHPKRRAKHA